MHPNKIAELPDDVLKVKDYLGKNIEWQYKTPYGLYYYARGKVLAISGLDFTVEMIQPCVCLLKHNYLEMVDIEILTDEQMTPATKENAQFAVFHGLEMHNEFFSINRKDKTEEQLCTTDDGEISYRILGYAHTCPEAQVMLSGYCSPIVRERKLA